MLITGLFSFIAGAIIGALLFMKFSPEQKKAKNIIKHLHDQQDEFKNYQLGVTQHFIDASRLLNQLSDSYSNLHNHLAKSAEDLCAQNTITPIIQPIHGKDSSTQDNPLPGSNNVNPPLDYAPRTTPYDRGTLNEEYGLEKVHIHNATADDKNSSIS